LTNLYIDNGDFVFSNIINSSFSCNEDIYYFLFGYCLVNDLYKHNESLTKEEFDLICENNISCSGVFAAIKVHKGNLTLVLDPLCQFNIFYHVNHAEKTFVISSNILLVKKFIPKWKLSESYFFDQVAYQSPMRGKTILDYVYYIQFDDLKFDDPWNQEFEYLDSMPMVEIVRPKYSTFDDLDYDELKQAYVENLKARSKTIATKFDEVHVQLTGGADSRLAFAALTSIRDISSYVYGDGKSQNRLIFEHLLAARKQKSVTEIEFVGQPLNTAERIIKGLIDSNFMKLNTLNTYMNAEIESKQEKCKITGYYGANVCGGVVLPPSDIKKNQRLKSYEPELFDYHDYVEHFKSRHGFRRRTSFNDYFYINNRGKGHYAAHSLADNRNISSIDILYDYINILLVEKCPYTDFEIDKNAISIDLIYEFDKQLALFPYDSRKIPKFKEFPETPLINCFDGYEFSSQDLPDFDIKRPTLTINQKIIDFVDNSNIKGYDFAQSTRFKEEVERFPMFIPVVNTVGAQSDIIRYYILAKLFLEA